MKRTIDIEFLFKGYLDGTLSEEDRFRLHHLLEYPEHRQRFAALIGEGYETASRERTDRQAAEVEDMIQYILHYETPEPRNGVVHRVHFLRTAWFKYAAAIILLVGVASYVYTFWSSKKNRQELTGAVHSPDQMIAPGRDKAILVLADKSIIDLDTLAIGSSIVQGNTVIMKTAKGDLFYSLKAEGSSKEEPVFLNTMRTPNGGQYQLTLPDGTQVWLNAATSVSYPVRFTGPERLVKINGEAYLEVAKNADKPFRVQTEDGTEVKVLGTHFNINSYPDEPVTAATLLEGSVQVTKAGASAKLSPGQQVAISKNTIRPVLNPRTANLENVIAWRKGAFAFQDAPLPILMRQLARWYDVRISYPEGEPADRVSGKIGRNLTLQEAVTVLNSIGIRCRVESRTLVVLP